MSKAFQLVIQFPQDFFPTFDAPCILRSRALSLGPVSLPASAVASGLESGVASLPASVMGHSHAPKVPLLKQVCAPLLPSAQAQPSALPGVQVAAACRLESLQPAGVITNGKTTPHTHAMRMGTEYMQCAHFRTSEASPSSRGESAARPNGIRATEEARRATDCP